MLCLPGLVGVTLSLQWWYVAGHWLDSVGSAALAHCTFSSVVIAYNTGTPFDPSAMNQTFQALLTANQQASDAHSHLLGLMLMIVFSGLTLFSYSILRMQRLALAIEAPQADHSLI